MKAAAPGGFGQPLASRAVGHSVVLWFTGGGPGDLAVGLLPCVGLLPVLACQDEQLRPKTPHFRREEGLSDWHCA